VAARGLDIPDVDWIVQFDPPDDPKVRIDVIFCLADYYLSDNPLTMDLRLMDADV